MKTYIIEWLKNYLISSKLDGFVIGVSGGIDSAVVSTLCALTNKQTIVVNMPIHQAKDQKNRGDNHIEWLKNNHNNILSYDINLTDTFDNFVNLFSNENKKELALANSRSRLRMITLYQIATSHNGLVVGTGNKVEDFGVGFFTKYGDGGVDISPIADLYKSEVRQLGRELGVSKDIIDAIPTDGLWEDNRSDESQIKATYEELEWAMEYIRLESKSVLTLRQKEVMGIFINLNNKSKHKIEAIPKCIIRR